MFTILCALGVTFGDDASMRPTTPSASSSHQVRGSIYHAYNFQLTVPSSRIERLLDPTTYIYASMLNLKQPCPSTSQQTMYCHVTLLVAQPLLSMHVRIIFNCYLLLLLGLGYHLIIIIVVDDMIIIIMLTIFDEGWKVGLSRLTFCSIRVT